MYVILAFQKDISYSRGSCKTYIFVIRAPFKVDIQQLANECSAHQFANVVYYIIVLGGGTISL